MHAAYNKVHPETLKVRTPYKDFFTLSTVCRQLEQKYGLTVDRGMEARGANALGPGARDYEAETWQESFQTHLLGHKQEIVRRALAAATWPALHAVLADYDAGIVRRGAGLALMGPNGEPMKACALDRSLAWARSNRRHPQKTTATRVSDGMKLRAATTKAPDGVKLRAAATKTPDGVKRRKTAATGRVPPRSASRQRPAIPTGRVRWSAATRRSRDCGSATAARGGPASRGGGRSDARSATGNYS